MVVDLVEPGPTKWERCKSFIWTHHLPLGLVFAVLFGAVCPWPGEWVSDNTPAVTICIILIFFLQGAKLRTSEIKTALRSRITIVLGIVMILFVTPWMAPVMLEVPLDDSLMLGLAIFANMPTTISSGAVLTAHAQGNVALALAFSVLTNLASVVTVPFVLAASANASSVDIDAGALTVKLVLTVLVPVVCGKLLTSFVEPAAQFMQTYAKPLKLLSNIALISIPWQKISTSADSFGDVSAGDFVGALFLGAAMHVVYLIVNSTAARLLIPLSCTSSRAENWQWNPESKAFVILASQKTLSIALVVVSLLEDEQDNNKDDSKDTINFGIASVSMIMAHMTQIVIDAVVASYLARRGEVLNEELVEDDENPPEFDSSSNEESPLTLSSPTDTENNKPATAAQVEIELDERGTGTTSDH
ncbi:MAG: hypothetical protein MHM6MM_001248 [Cercozoa sp. M6MM]